MGNQVERLAGLPKRSLGHVEATVDVVEHQVTGPFARGVINEPAVIPLSTAEMVVNPNSEPGNGHAQPPSPHAGNPIGGHENPTGSRRRIGESHDESGQMVQIPCTENSDSLNSSTQKAVLIPDPKSLPSTTARP